MMSDSLTAELDGDEINAENLSAYSILHNMDEDERLYKCFLYALRHKIQRSQLPVLVTQFYNNYVKACW